MSDSNILPAALRQNFRHFYSDMFWFGVLLGSTLTFLAVYLSRIGASSLEIGLLTAGPALVNLVLSLPAGRWLQGRSLLRITFRFSVMYRMIYLLLIPIPWLFPASVQVKAILSVCIVLSMPGTVLAIAFNSLFAELVPADWRAEVFSRRNAIFAVSTTTTSLVCGILLDKLLFPINYQIVFSLGALGAMLSSYHLSRLRQLTRAPELVGVSSDQPARPVRWRFFDRLRAPLGIISQARPGGAALVRLDLLRTSFGLFLVAFLFFYTVQYIPTPLFPLHFVNNLHLTDGAISLGNALYYTTMLLFSLRVRRASDRFGHYRILVFGAFSYSLYPFLTWLARDARLYWIASIAGGGSWAITSAGLMNRLMEKVPEGDRPAHMALHNLALNLGILAGSLLGPAFVSWFDLREAILISAGLRFLGGLLLWRWG